MRHLMIAFTFDVVITEISRYNNNRYLQEGDTMRIENEQGFVCIELDCYMEDGHDYSDCVLDPDNAVSIKFYFDTKNFGWGSVGYEYFTTFDIAKIADGFDELAGGAIDEFSYSGAFPYQNKDANDFYYITVKKTPTGVCFTLKIYDGLMEYITLTENMSYEKFVSIKDEFIEGKKRFPIRHKRSALRKLEEMCYDPDFDIETAKSLIAQIDVDEVFQTKKHNMKTPLLGWAIMWANIRLVKLLLENGANPNLVYDCESPFWDLQYNDGDTDEENEIRLQMAQLMLEYGASPNINPEDGPDDLFHYVLDMVFNDDDFGDLWEYRSRFFILLIAYGGQTSCCIPRIIGTFDKSNMQQYTFDFVPEEPGRYSGVIVDGQGNEIAYV